MEDITRTCKEKVDEIAYVIGDRCRSGKSNSLPSPNALAPRGTIHYQDEPLGTAHAILCAQSALQGKVIVAFADTLFVPSSPSTKSRDGVIWVNRIDDPRMFGVVKLDGEGFITDFVEKPQEFISDLAIIIGSIISGRRIPAQGAAIPARQRHPGKRRVPATNALENMKRKGAFRPG